MPNFRAAETMLRHQKHSGPGGKAFQWQCVGPIHRYIKHANNWKDTGQRIVCQRGLQEGRLWTSDLPTSLGTFTRVENSSEMNLPMIKTH